MTGEPTTSSDAPTVVPGVVASPVLGSNAPLDAAAVVLAASGREAVDEQTAVE
jgi:hypothetical protein